MGAIGGAVTGAYLGRDPLTSAVGATAGLIIGHEIGAMFDKVDQIHATMLLRQTLTNNPNGQMSTWENPEKGFSVTQALLQQMVIVKSLYLKLQLEKS